MIKLVSRLMDFLFGELPYSQDEWDRRQKERREKLALRFYRRHD